MGRNSIDQQKKLANAFEIMNGIVALEGIPHDAMMNDIQRQIISGELSFNEAVQLVLDAAKPSHHAKPCIDS